jgi:hypothetical protein
MLNRFNAECGVQVRVALNNAFDSAFTRFPTARFFATSIAATVAMSPMLASATTPAQPAALPNPIMFVTQMPIPADFATIGSTFANHQGGIDVVGRGGDLYIRYPDGTLRNLTQEAGYGMTGRQGADAIAVRDPAISWDGTKAVFSMVIGAPTQQYQWGTWYWQMYEITGFGQGQTVSITKVANQPANYNNVEPTYGSDGSIIFVSDQPRNKQRYLYPQQDEYESTVTPTGLWKLDRTTGTVNLLQHSPSGSFNPLVDSFGRVIFTRWDHLQRDQQADAGNNGNFNWASEAQDAPMLNSVAEVFPELRGDTPGVYGFRMDQFFPWMVNQDGTGEETLNHIGRHELSSYINRTFMDDSALKEFIAPGYPPRTNQNPTENWLQMHEDPSTPGRYIAIDAPEFYSHASGQIVAITAPPTSHADTLSVNYLTPRSTSVVYDGSTPPADFTGHYRNPLIMSDGQVVSGFTSYAGTAGNLGTRANPNPKYKFRLQRLSVGAGGYLQPAEALTGAGITKSISYFDPDVLVTYNAPLWEMSPVEVRARTTPPSTTYTLQNPETQAFALENVDADAFRSFLAERGLAVLVSRNVTTRDSADRQQPYNLSVPGGVQTIGVDPQTQTTSTGQVYDITYAQFLQGDQIRGIGGMADPRPGRRVLAQPLHDAGAYQFMAPTPAGAPAGSVKIAADGSIAAIVPAGRALAWQTTSADGTPVVRERYWISAQPGEVRACDGCHGVNETNQAGQPAAQNTPQALRDLISYWRDHHESVFSNGFDQ